MRKALHCLIENPVVSITGLKVRRLQELIERIELSRQNRITQVMMTPLPILLRWSPLFNYSNHSNNNNNIKPSVKIAKCITITFHLSKKSLNINRYHNISTYKRANIHNHLINSSNSNIIRQINSQTLFNHNHNNLSKSDNKSYRIRLTRNH